MLKKHLAPLALAVATSAGPTSADAFHWAMVGQPDTGHPLGAGHVAAAPTFPGQPIRLNLAHPSGYAVFLNPANYAAMMNPATYAQFMNPGVHMQFANPENWMAWMHPASYAPFMNPATYMQMMNPGAYVQFMNPATYMQWMNPASYSVFMNPATYMQWMDPRAYGAATDGTAGAAAVNPFDPDTWAQYFDPNAWMQNQGTAAHPPPRTGQGGTDDEQPAQ